LLECESFESVVLVPMKQEVLKDRSRMRIPHHSERRKVTFVG
jgi:hypothetical protein